VLDAVRHGLSRRQIAARRGVSVDAVRWHTRSIARKLGVSGVPALRHWTGYPVTSPLGGTEEAVMRSDHVSGVSLGQLGQVSLLVRDVGRAEAFYRDVLGLPHLFTFGDLAFFDCGGTRLFLRAVPDDEWRAGSILYFRVDDIRLAHRELAERGVAFDGAPHLIYRDDDSGDEEWMAFFRDSEGNLLAVMARTRPATAIEW
jgi:catechol 2,3-dioxygenase-like lactoylglutathione lyase family enzyme